MKKKARIERNLTLIYWRGKKFWLGKLLENPEIMTQGKTVQELIENIKDAYYQMILGEIPQDLRIKEITVRMSELL
jgi:predicted RNase H-like HicB family nuclease